METNGQGPLPAYAAELAPEIDRLFVAGHRAARPFALPVLQDRGVTDAGILIDLRRQLLSPKGCTLQQATAKQRYADPATVEAALREQVRRGLLDRQGNAFYPTQRGRTVLLDLTEALARGVHSLWGRYERVVKEAGERAASLLEPAAEAVPIERFPAFEAERGGFLPDHPSPGEILWSHLSALRYLRADAHAMAWQEAGLNRVEIECLTAFWRSSGELVGSPEVVARTEDEGLRMLRRRGWLRPRREGSGASQSWELTPEGSAARDRIEAATNRYNAPPLGAMAREQRERFLYLLRLLPPDEAGGRK